MTVRAVAADEPHAADANYNVTLRLKVIPANRMG
jgi:hypothetical protein